MGISASVKEKYPFMIGKQYRINVKIYMRCFKDEINIYNYDGDEYHAIILDKDKDKINNESRIIFNEGIEFEVIDVIRHANFETSDSMKLKVKLLDDIPLNAIFAYQELYKVDNIRWRYTNKDIKHANIDKLFARKNIDCYINVNMLEHCEYIE